MIPYREGVVNRSHWGVASRVTQEHWLWVCRRKHERLRASGYCAHLRFYASFNEVRFTEEIRMTNTTDPSATVNENPPTLRLVWPQWQGASVEAMRELFPEVP